MEKEIIAYLEQLGLYENEAKLYLALLEIGSAPVSVLAKAAGINRATAYLHINRLIEKGLVMEMVKGSRSLIAANQPEESLKHLVEQRVQSVKAVQEEFSRIVQTICAKQPQVKDVGGAEIRYY